MLQDGASLHMPSVVYVMRETVCPDEPGGFDAVRQCEQPEALREASQCSDGCETMLGIIIAFRSGVTTKKNSMENKKNACHICVGPPLKSRHVKGAHLIFDGFGRSAAYQC